MGYRVEFTKPVLDRNDQLTREAIQHGQDAAGIVRAMVANLREDPLIRGEALYHFSNGEPAHHYVESPISMWFVIHVAFRVVFIYRLDRMAASDESLPDPL